MESERFRKIADLEMQNREIKSAGASFRRQIDFRVVANDRPPIRASRAFRSIDALAWPPGRAGFFKLGGLICGAAVSAAPTGGTPGPQSSANRTTRFFPAPIRLNDPPRQIKISSAATLPANQIKPTSARCGLFHLERRR
jgi:hypothetical protein